MSIFAVLFCSFIDLDRITGVYTWSGGLCFKMHHWFYFHLVNYRFYFHLAKYWLEPALPPVCKHWGCCRSCRSWHIYDDAKRERKSCMFWVMLQQLKEKGGGGGGYWDLNLWSQPRLVTVCPLNHLRSGATVKLISPSLYFSQYLPHLYFSQYLPHFSNLLHDCV